MELNKPPTVSVNLHGRSLREELLSLLDPIDPAVIEEINVVKEAAIRRLEHAESSYEGYVNHQLRDIVDSFKAVGLEHSAHVGMDIPSEQRHFCFDEKMHKDLYLGLLTELQIFPTPEEAKYHIDEVTPQAKDVAERTPEDKVALMESRYPVRAEGFQNLGVVIAQHLNQDGSTYAVSVTPTIIEHST